jgi:hypothetical protein
MLFLIRRSAAIARARDVASGDDDVAGDVEYQPLFGNRQDATCLRASNRAGGKADSNRSRCSSFTSIGSRTPAIVQGARVGADDKARCAFSIAISG